MLASPKLLIKKQSPPKRKPNTSILSSREEKVNTDMLKLMLNRLKKLDPDAKVSKNTKRSEGFEFINSIKGGVIPIEFIPAVEKGIKEGMERGFWRGTRWWIFLASFCLVLIMMWIRLK